jgi:ribosomal protein S12 methylthiotransferase accessory factor
MPHCGQRAAHRLPPATGSRHRCARHAGRPLAWHGGPLVDVTGPAGLPARLEPLEALMPRCGITRIADLTGLDVTGLPVAAAIRPLAVTAPVSTGAGPTAAAAREGAVLAALALWHAEARVPAAEAGGATAAELGGACEFSALALPPGTLAGRLTPLEWVTAAPAAGGPPVLVPRDLVWMGRRPRARWQPARLAATVGGLAAETTRPRAVARALCDLAAREAAAALPAVPPALRCYVRLDTVPDPWPAAAAAAVTAAGGRVSVAAVRSWPRMACFAAWLHLDGPVSLAAAATAASPDPVAALRAAIAAAARSRTAMTAGITDPPGGHRYPAGRCDPPAPPGRVPLGWEALPEEISGWPQGPALDLPGAVLRSCEASGARPLAVDLPAGSPRLAVVKVLLARPAGERRPAGLSQPAGAAA